MEDKGKICRNELLYAKSITSFNLQNHPIKEALLLVIATFLIQNKKT